ncbi:MAG: SLBB domain-containing protein [Actinobacteria bacterium]|nr:SLBB domain-containing protein [Actinomycetota bacterium]MBI3688861.1 SLBB domain-containing protein [Actinomycetota bacterium]
MAAAGQARPADPDSPYRLLAGWVDTGRPADLAAHQRRHGPLPVPAYPGRAGPHRLIGVVDRSGLRGRGGAGFPTGRKLTAVAAGRRRPIVLANGCEGEPASRKDHVLLSVAPHLVLDGAILAAYAVGAEEAVVCLHAQDPLADTLRAAIAARSGDPVPLRVAEVPDRYVASEASALVNFLNTGDPRPTAKPPRPFERGVRGRPTLVDNVETLAHLAMVARYGPEWFRRLGGPDSPGTTLVTVTGAVRLPGVYEVPLGTSIGQVLELAGGAAEELQAVLVGGYGGSWLPLPSGGGIRLTHADLQAAGASLGVAALVVLPARGCGLAETARVLRYLAGESAAQCGPCMFGLPAIAADLTAVVEGAAGRRGGAVLDRLGGRLEVIRGRGACAHPDGAVRLASSALRVFGTDVRRHLSGRPCPWAAGGPRLPVPGDAAPGAR